jgi:hypothetical protein
MRNIESVIYEWEIKRLVLINTALDFFIYLKRKNPQYTKILYNQVDLKMEYKELIEDIISRDKTEFRVDEEDEQKLYVKLSEDENDNLRKIIKEGLNIYLRPFDELLNIQIFMFDYKDGDDYNYKSNDYRCKTLLIDVEIYRLPWWADSSGVKIIEEPTYFNSSLPKSMELAEIRAYSSNKEELFDKYQDFIYDSMITVMRRFMALHR